MPALLVSCMGDSRTYNLSEEGVVWFSKDTTGAEFMLRDDNQMTQSYRCTMVTAFYDVSSSSFLVFRTKTTRRHVLYSEWTSGYGNLFSIMLTAGTETTGDVLTVTLNDYVFMYDIGHEEIFSVSTPHGSLHSTLVNGRYTGGDKIVSEAVVIPYIQIGAIGYSNVMHISFRDLQAKWTDYTITDIYIAAGIGLVQVTYKSGLVVRRI